LLDALETARRSLTINTPQGDADALAISDDVLQQDPANPHAMFLAGTALYRMKQNGLAAILFNTASQLNPGEASVWNNLGCSLREFHPRDAVAVFRKAIECNPDHVEANKNLAACLGRIGRRGEAIAVNKKLREGRPDDPDIPYNLALDLLHTDDWDAAFEAYRYSEGNAQRTVRNYHADRKTPRWDFESPGKIVIYGEQGVGDEILAAAAYDRMQEWGGDENRFILECDKRLEGLFKRSFPWATVYGTRDKTELAWPSDEKPDAALIAMAAFGSVASSTDRPEPWLTPDPILVDMFRKLLSQYGTGKKIGLSWTGGAKEWDRMERAVPIEVLGPVVNTPDAVVVSLEYVDGPKPEGVIDLSWATRKGVDLDVTAALIAALDVVVSVPQTVCDIAGAVGTPIRAMVHENPPWRFAEAAGDAWIWKDCKTYRKEPGSSWMPVVTKLARSLREEWGMM